MNTLKTYALPASAPDCPFTFDVCVGTHCHVWISAGPPETREQWEARREAEGEQYFPRFSIQIETFDSAPQHYYDCWDASEYWQDMLTEAADAALMVEEMDYAIEQELPVDAPLRELLGLDPWMRGEPRPELTPEQRAKLEEFYARATRANAEK
jgi:hypothetical protein